MRDACDIIKQTNELARMFYELTGCQVECGFEFDKSTHGAEVVAWRQACIAQEVLTGTCINDVIEELEDDLQRERDGDCSPDI